MHFLALIAGGDNGPRQDIICLNAALIFYLTERSTDIAAGIEKGRRILKDGLAMDKLRQWVQAQNSNPAAGTEKLNNLLRQAG